MGLVLDLLVILIIAIFSYLSSKKGFVRTLIEVVGFVLALIITFTISTPISNSIYDNFFADSINKKIISSSEAQITDVEILVNNAWEKLPTIVTNNQNAQTTKQDIINTAREQNVKNTTQLAETVSNKFIKPVVTSFISLIIKIILFIALIFAVKFIAKAINKLFSFSAVGKVNKTLGALVGIVKGTFFAIFFCLLIGFIITLTKDDFWIFTNDAVNSSYIFKFFLTL